MIVNNKLEQIWREVTMVFCKVLSWLRVRRLLVTANAVPSSPFHVTLMMEALGFSKNVGSYKNHME
jgi:multidrug efflux pump subunit AcrB